MKTAWRGLWVWVVPCALGATAPAHADITAQTEQGFVSRNVVMIDASPAAVWKRLIAPAAWWSSDHTFSGDAANLTLDPVPGGCFCERLPDDDAAPAQPPKPGAAQRPPTRGGVMHMRVVFVDRAKALRLVGALGPLQSEAVNATLTITIKSVDRATRVIFEYVVGGYMRYPPEKIAAAVDTVMANQLVSLASAFGTVATAAPAAPQPPQDAVVRPTQPGPRGLDAHGLIVPHGRVWSLPAGAPPAPPNAPPTPAATAVTPLPVNPLPQDAAASGGSAPATTAPPAPQTRSAARAKPAKPTPRPTPSHDAPGRDSIDAAFDAAFGGAPRPKAEPQ